MTALTSICYFCVNNSSFMIVIVSGRKYVSMCSAGSVGFTSLQASSGPFLSPPVACGYLGCSLDGWLLFSTLLLGLKETF